MVTCIETSLFPAFEAGGRTSTGFVACAIHCWTKGQAGSNSFINCARDLVRYDTTELPYHGLAGLPVA